MASDVVTIKRIGKNSDIVKISIEEGVEATNAIPQLSQLIDNCYKNNMFKIILDMQRIRFPSSSFIALLIEKTVQARRVNGELKLINLAPSAVNNLVTFSTLNYLSTEGDEGFALEELEILKTSSPIESDFTTEKSELPPPIPTKPEMRVNKQTSSHLHIPNRTHDLAQRSNFSSALNKPKETVQSSGTVQSKPKIHQPVPATKNETTVVQTPTPVPPKPKVELTTKRIRVKSQIESLYDICDFVTNLAEHVGFSEKEVGKIKVTVYEACLNVIEHAYHSDSDEWIVVTVQFNDRDFIITIQDWGQSFNFDDSKTYDVNQAVQDRQTGGFGLFIIRRSMDAVKYKTDPINGNRLILTKLIPQR